MSDPSLKAFWENLPALLKKPWIKILIVLFMAAMVVYVVPKAKGMKERSDHFVIWNAGKNFYEHQPLYNPDNIRPYIYTPFAAFLFQPLHLVSYKVSAAILFLLCALVLLPLTLVMLYRILVITGHPPWRSRMAVALALLLSLKYSWNNLMMFQINQAIFFIMVAGIYFLAKKKPHLSGIIFTVITFIKIIPIFLAAYVFLYHFSRKVALSMILTVMVCLLLPAAFRGPAMLYQDYRTYYQE